MSKIMSLGRDHELWITYSWSSNNHGICGHIYEVIDYFYILKDYFKVGILLCEDLTWHDVEAVVRAKYAFSDDEIDIIRKSTVFNNRPSLVTGSNILIVDGGVVSMANKTLLFDNIFYFACGNKEVKDNVRKNVYILQDDRVYGNVAVNGVNYKKRILFEKLKPVTKCVDRLLVYATKNCRNIDSYEELFFYGDDIIAITNSENRPKDIEGVTFVTPPVDNIFEQFSKYIYTPVARKWDCSPRFIAECRYFNKEVIYHNINYWDIDHGLRIRKHDIDVDFDSLALTKDDEIVRIIGNIIC